MTELPLACALDAGALSAREGEIRGLFGDTLVGFTELASEARSG